MKDLYVSSYCYIRVLRLLYFCWEQDEEVQDLDEDEVEDLTADALKEEEEEEEDTGHAPADQSRHRQEAGARQEDEDESDGEVTVNGNRMSRYEVGGCVFVVAAPTYLCV